METTLAANPIVTHENRLDVLGADPDFEIATDDIVCEAFEFLGAMGLGEADCKSIAVDMTELS